MPLIKKTLEFIFSSKKAVLAALVSLCALSGAMAATYTWTGSEDSLWSNPNNWDLGACPNSTDDVVFPGGAYVEVDDVVEVQNITTSPDSYGSVELDVSAGKALTCNWIFIVNKDSASHGADLTISGMGKVDCYGVDIPQSISGGVDEFAISLNIDGNLVVRAKMYLNVSSDITVHVDGSGNLTVPVGGIIVGSNTELFRFNPSSDLSVTSDGVSYYSFYYDENSDFSDSDDVVLTFTIGVNSNGSTTATYLPYKITDYYCDDSSVYFSVDGTDFDDGDIGTLNDEDDGIYYSPSMLTRRQAFDITCSDYDSLVSGDYFSLEIYSPDGFFVIGRIDYVFDAGSLVPTKEFRWTGNDSRDWESESNWQRRYYNESNGLYSWKIADEWPGYTFDDAEVSFTSNHEEFCDVWCDATVATIDFGSEGNSRVNLVFHSNNSLIVTDSASVADGQSIVFKPYNTDVDPSTTFFDSEKLILAANSSIELTPLVTATIGDLTIGSSATFTAPLNGTFAVTNSLTNNGGNFVHNGSTLIADGLTVSSTSALDFYNIQLKNVLTSNKGIVIKNEIEIAGDSSLNAPSLVFDTSSTGISGGHNLIFAADAEVKASDIDFDTNITQSSGTFKASSGTMNFLGSAYFSSCDGFDANGGTINFFNTGSGTHTFETSDGMVLNDFYFGGKVDIVLNGAVSAKNYQIPNQTYSGGRFAQTSTFTATTKGSGTLKITEKMKLGNSSASTSVVGNCVFDVDVDYSATDSAEINVGSYLTIKKNFDISNARLVATSYSLLPQMVLDVYGNLSMKGILELAFGTSRNCAKVIVRENGEINAKKISWDSTNASKSYGSGDPLTIEAGGTVNVTDGIDVIKTDSTGAELVLINNGTINCTGTTGTEEISAAKFSGTGEINFAGGKITAASATDSGSVETLNISGDTEFDATALLSVANAVISDSVKIKSNEKTSFVNFTDNTGSSTLTVSGGIKVTGVLDLSGTDESNLLSVVADTSDAVDDYFLISSAQPSAGQPARQYLSVSTVTIGKKPAGWNGIDPAVSYTIENSVCADDVVPYGWIFNEAYEWTGAAGTSNWKTKGNWSGNVVPTSSNSVIIGDGCSVYPILTQNVTVKSLTVGEAVAPAVSDARIVIGNYSLKCMALANPLINRGTIVFNGNGRIVNSSDASIMDTSRGTVEYGLASTDAGVITDFGGSGAAVNSVADYYNLVIKAGTWTINGSNIKAENDFTVESGATLTLAAASEINSPLLNKGTVNAGTAMDPAAGTVAFWDDFTNGTTGTVNINRTIWIANSAKKVTDSGTWNSGATVAINLNVGNDFEFDASAGTVTTNRYRFANTFAADYDITFKGNPSSPMKISFYSDAAKAVSNSNIFENVEFLASSVNAGGANAGKVLAASEMTGVLFDSDVEFAADIDFDEGEFKETALFSSTATLGEVTAKNITIGSGASVSGTASKTVSLTGNWTNNEGTTGFDAAGGKLLFENGAAQSEISGDNIFNEVEIKKSAKITGSNTFVLLTMDTSSIPSIIKIEFGGGKTQTVSQIKATGNSGSSYLLLDSTDTATPAQWNICFASTPGDGINNSPLASDFVNTKINLSHSVSGTGLDNDLHLIPRGETVTELTPSAPTCGNWFTYDFYWTGTASSAWNLPANWAYDEEGNYVCVASPDYSYGTSNIFILSDKTHYPELPGDSSFSSLELKTGTNPAELYLLGYSLEVNDKFINNGNIHLFGTQLSAAASTIVLPSAAGSVTENGTWSFFGNFDGNYAGNGKIRSIPNMASFKNVVVEGNGAFAAPSPVVAPASAGDCFKASKLYLNKNAETDGGNSLTVDTTLRILVNDIELAGDESFTIGSGKTFGIGTTSGYDAAKITGKGKLSFAGGGTLNLRTGIELSDGTDPAGEIEFGMTGTVNLYNSLYSAADISFKDSSKVNVSATSSTVKADSVTFGSGSGDVVFGGKEIIFDGDLIQNSDVKVSCASVEFAAADSLVQNSNVWIFDGDGAQTVATKGLAFDDLTFKNSAGTTVSDDLNAKNLTVEALLTASENVDSENLSIGASGIFTSADGKEISISKSWKNLNSGAGFVPQKSLVKIVSKDGVSAAATGSGEEFSVTGNTTFYDFSAEDLGGDKISLDGDFTVQNNLTFTGSNANSLLEIAGNDSDRNVIKATISIGSNQTSGKYICVSGVTIGTTPAGIGVNSWNGEMKAGDFSYSAAVSTPSGDYVPYGWIFEQKYVWSGTESRDWNNFKNWAYDDGGTLVAASTVPNFWAKVTVPKKANEPRLSDDGDGKIEVRTLSLGEEMGLWLNGFDFTVTEGLSNSGNIHLFGTENVKLYRSETVLSPGISSFNSTNTENGTWSYFGKESGSSYAGDGTIAPVKNLSYRHVVAEGNGTLSGFEAEDFETCVSEAVTDSDVEMNLSASTTLKLSAVKINTDTKINLNSRPLGICTPGTVGTLTGTNSLKIDGNRTGTDERVSLRCTVNLDGDLEISGLKGRIDACGSTIKAAKIILDSSELTLGNSTMNAGNAASVTLTADSILLGSSSNTMAVSNAEKTLIFDCQQIDFASSEIDFASKTVFGPSDDSSKTIALTFETVKFNNDVALNWNLDFTGTSAEFGAAVSAAENLKTSGEIIFNGNFAQPSAKDFEVASGSVLVKKYKFEAGNLKIASGASFVQKGYNTSDETALGTENKQSVSSILNNGNCEWDETDAGGTLTLNGGLTGANASKIVFNRKNVTIGASAELSGVFYDLHIPSGIEVKNGQGIVVRRNFTCDGTFDANSPVQTLTLGGVTFARTYPSHTGRIACSNSADPGNFGNVVVNGLVTLGTAPQKTFATDFLCESIVFDSSDAISGLVFGDSLQPLRGVTLDSKVDFEIPCPVELVSDTSILSKAKTVTFDSEVSSSSLKKLSVGAASEKTNAVYLGDVSAGEIEVWGTSVFDKPSAQFVATTGNQKYHSAVTFAPSLLVTASDGISASTVEFDSTLTGTSDVAFGTAILKTDVVFRADVSTVSKNQTYTGNVRTENDDVFAANGIVVNGKWDSLNSVEFNANDISFNGDVSAASDFVLALAGTADFHDRDFVQSSGKDFDITGGIVKTGKGKFIAANLKIGTGCSFIQTGLNDEFNDDGISATQSVESITSNGTCVWDSGEEGGFLTLKGSVDGANGETVQFNRKNVKLDSNLTLTGIFLDLLIPSGITATNGQGIVVRRNFTVNGTYADNSQKLTLGSASFGGKTFASESGRISDNNSAVPNGFGNVFVNLDSTEKNFSTDFAAATLTFDVDANDAAGKLIFGDSVKSAADPRYFVKLTSLSSFEIPCPVELVSDTKIYAEGKTVTVSSSMVSGSSCALELHCENFTASSALSFDLSKIEFFNLNYTASGKQNIKAGKIFAYFNENKNWTGNFEFFDDFALFGPKYSADDPRYSGSDTRFELYGYGSYSPAGTSAVLAGGAFKVNGNFYANGVDLTSISLSIPDNSASNPVFNDSNSVSQRQWGIPYAVAFNSKIKNVTVSEISGSGSAWLGAASADSLTSGATQNCLDEGGNTNVQFAVPHIDEAYSVYDDVVYVHFDMLLENSNGEIKRNFDAGSALLNGGIWYNSNSLRFEGIYGDADCTVPVSLTADLQEFYIRTLQEKWNTDATGWNAGNAQSSDRGGVHHSVTTDLSFLEGLFTAAKGHTMCRNYGTNLEGGTAAPVFSDTLDKAKPVLTAVYTGQERHEGSAMSQKIYDAHNFLEFQYSETVDVDTLAADGGDLNVQATLALGSIENLAGGLKVSGFAAIAGGELTAGIKSKSGRNWSGTVNTYLPHALYRNYSLTKTVSQAQNQTHRIRISVAGFVDEENPVTANGTQYRNYLGYIDSSATPSGAVLSLANSLIKDYAVDLGGNRIFNEFEDFSAADLTQNHKMAALVVNARPQSVASVDSGLYGSWDVSHPTFATYVTSYSGTENSWNHGDSEDRQYEMIGYVDSPTNPYLEKIEMHLFDDTHAYSDSDACKWYSRTGWTTNDSRTDVIVKGPETVGGSRSFETKNEGGIRRSSLDSANSAFVYKYKLNSGESDYRDFSGTQISQQVKSGLFTYTDPDDPASATVTETFDDGLYFSLRLNSQDSQLPRRTIFTVMYAPGTTASPKSFITDLAGNRLIQTDSGKAMKILHSVDITPPELSVTLAPIGEDKIYAVFTKPLAYRSIPFENLSASMRNEVLSGISQNFELVTKAATIDGASLYDAHPFSKADFVSSSSEYTAILLTLKDKKISLDDVENLWLRVNDNVSDTRDWSGGFTSYVQDLNQNGIVTGTCHVISDFALNAVNVLYAYADEIKDPAGNSDDWNEQGIYGSGIAPLSSDYAVHDFAADGGNYGKLRTGRDITLQVQFVGGEDGNGYFAPQNGETIRLIPDLKKNIRADWIADKYNRQTESRWRVWLNSELDSFASGYNPSPLTSPEISPAGDSKGLLWNFHFLNSTYNFAAKDEYQFIFKVQDSDGNDIMMNHDGDDTTAEVPLYALWMPKNRIEKGDFSFIDLWSFTLSDVTKQRGGVTILNNVIDVNVREQAVIQVDMKSAGNLNIYIMTLDGNIVRRLSKGRAEAGTHYFKWDGTNLSGKAVARGMYFVRVSGPGIDETRKIMCVKN